MLIHTPPLTPLGEPCLEFKVQKGIHSFFSWIRWQRLGLLFAVLLFFPLILLADVEANHTQAGLAHPPASGSLFYFPERLPQEDGSLLTAHRGWLFVPMSRSAAELNKQAEDDSPEANRKLTTAADHKNILAIEFYQFHATEDAPENVPPVFLLNGGPGFPGLVNRLEPGGRFYKQFVEPITKFTDLVVVGQRGIGSSKPDTICDNKGGVFGLGACKTFWEQAGYDLKHLNVREAAADVNDLAIALGYESSGISLMGNSFGSHWGMAVMRFHPEIVKRALLSGLEGPDHTFDSPTGVLKALEAIAASAESNQALASSIPEGGIIAAFKSVLDRARGSRIQFEVENPETGERKSMSLGLSDLQRLAKGYSGSISTRDGIRTWPADILALYYENYERFGLTKIPNPDQEEASSQSPSFRTASFYNLDCGSGISKARLEAYQKDPAQKLLGSSNGMITMVCPVWDADMGEAFRQNFKTTIPTLLVHGTWDVNTPYTNALELEPFFLEGHLVTVVGGSHSAFREAMHHSESFEQKVYEFLKTGSLDSMPEQVVLPEPDWEILEVSDP